METGLLHLHNIMRWIVLITMLLTLFRTARGLGGKRVFTDGDRKTALFMMISADIQLLLGLALYYLRGYALAFTNGGEVMSNKAMRFWAVEHITGMLIGIVLIHIAYASSKRITDNRATFKKVFWYTFIALIVIMATIPWPFREMVGRPLFPGQ